MAPIVTKLSCKDRITKTRTKLLVGDPFFGQLALKLKVVESEQVSTACTDGTFLIFNPKFVAELNDIEFRGLMAHEIMHCALRHMYRINGRDHELWNIACDFAINQILVDANFTLPKGALLADHFRGMTAEQIYADLQQHQEKKPKDNGQGATGSFTKPGGLGDKAEDENGNKIEAEPLSDSDWQIASEAATMIAKKAGKLPGGIESSVKANKPQKDWREELRSFIERTLPSDYSWLRPNRRHLANGVYFPGIEKENCPRIAIGFDTSGSIYSDPKLLSLFASEINGILHDAKPEAIDIYYCDSRVCRVDTFTPDDSELTFDKVPGGGGTEFQPVFDEIETRAEDQPALCIYLTDQMGPQPKDPPYPVLWVVPEQYNPQWGDVITLTEFTPV